MYLDAQSVRSSTSHLRFPTYWTPRYEQLREAVRARFPGCDGLEPRYLFSDAAVWLARWPNLMGQLARLVFFHDGSGFIGKGVHTEICDCLLAGKPVHYLDDGGILHHHTDFLITDIDECDWQHYARVSLRMEVR